MRLHHLFVALMQQALWIAMWPLQVAMMLAAYAFDACSKRHHFNPQHICITGAASGIGSGLANALARPGRRFTLSDVNAAGLARVKAEVEAKGATVEVAVVDVTNRAETAAWITAADDAHPIDLLFANAGIAAHNSGVPHAHSDDSLDEAAHRVMSVNCMGVLHTVGPMVTRMKHRHGGQIVITASLAGYTSSSIDPAYSASKAAAWAYGHGLRMRLHNAGVKVNVVCPGFIATPLTDSFTGTQPFRINLATAIKAILDGVASDDPIIAFPASTFHLVALFQSGVHWLVREGMARLHLAHGSHYMKHAPTHPPMHADHVAADGAPSSRSRKGVGGAGATPTTSNPAAPAPTRRRGSSAAPNHRD